MFSFAEYKKYRAHIKKKSEQVLRLRKKAKTGGHKAPTSISDPSVQRLIEQSNRDLNQQYKQLYDTEKQCLRKILTEERHPCHLTLILLFSKKEATIGIRLGRTPLSINDCIGSMLVSS